MRRPSASRWSTAALLLATLGLLTACSQRVEDTHPQQWVSQRQAVFKDFTRTLEPMVLMSRERQPFAPDTFRSAALRLQALSALPWPFFTPDSNYAPTKAQSRVWEEPAAFTQAQEQFMASVLALVQSAEAGTLDAVRAPVDDVQKSCKACHDQFRRN